MKSPEFGPNTEKKNYPILFKTCSRKGVAVTALVLDCMAYWMTV